MTDSANTLDSPDDPLPFYTTAVQAPYNSSSFTRFSKQIKFLKYTRQKWETDWSVLKLFYDAGSTAEVIYM